MANGNDRTIDWYKNFNSWLLILIGLILSYNTITVNNLKVQVAVLNREVTDHNLTANLWIMKIQENEETIEALKDKNVEDHQAIKDWATKTFVTKQK